MIHCRRIIGVAAATVSLHYLYSNTNLTLSPLLEDINVLAMGQETRCDIINFSDQYHYTKMGKLCFTYQPLYSTIKNEKHLKNHNCLQRHLRALKSSTSSTYVLRKISLNQTLLLKNGRTCNKLYNFKLYSYLLSLLNLFKKYLQKYNSIKSG